MAVNVGILGMGVMGTNHFAHYQRIKGVRVVAICDVDPKKRRGKWSGTSTKKPPRRRTLSGEKP